MSSYIDSDAVFRDFFTVEKVGSTIGALESEISASDTSIVLASGYTPLEKGPRVVKIDDELIVVTGTGDTLSVVHNGRGFFSTTAILHSSSTSVIRATFSQCLTNVQLGRMEEFTNTSPGLAFIRVGSWSSVAVERMHKPRVQLHIYGGKDSEGKMRPESPVLLNGLLQERCDDLDNTGQESVAGGTIMTADYYGEEGQLLYDPDTRPPWPFVLTFLDCETKGN